MSANVGELRKPRQSAIMQSAPLWIDNLREAEQQKQLAEKE